MHSLIVWQDIPDNTRVFSVPDSEITPRQRKILEESHNVIINVDDDTTSVDQLSELLAAEWKQYRQVDPQVDSFILPLQGPYSNVYVTGCAN